MQRAPRRALWYLFVVVMLIAPGLPAEVRADPLTDWTPGPNAVLDDTYDGVIDAPALNTNLSSDPFMVSGWFVDRTAQGWAGADDVQIWQGTMDGGGTMLAHAAFAQDRPDVAAFEGNPFWEASGFGGVVPAGALGAGPQVLSVYVHAGEKGWWYKQVQVNVSSSAGAPQPAAASGGGASTPIVGIEKPKDGEVVLTKSDYEIIGYAVDKNAAPNQGVAGSGIDRVQVYIGAERENGGTFVGEATLAYSDPVPVGLYGGQFASAGWRLTFKPTLFHSNTYLMFAYARSAISGKEDVVSRFFQIREQAP
jgi:hypothetical protein